MLRKFGFLKEPPPQTLKDPRLLGYLKLRLDCFYRCVLQPKRKSDYGTWTAVAQDTWPEIWSNSHLLKLLMEEVTFGDNEKGKIIGTGKICIIPSSYIANFILVEGLKYNLLSINQFYDKDFKVIFESSLCIVSRLNDNEIMLIGHRHGNIYMVDLDDLPMQDGHCLVAMESKGIEAN